MEIKDNILKHYLKNCYFINGTAYAGKSTMCKMLAEKYDMIHCEENYNMDTILSVVTAEEQPDLNYFNTMKGFGEYISRSPDEFERWFHCVANEVTGFEIAELIRVSSNKKVIVDTNISCENLKKISAYNRVAIMLSPQSMSVENFFNRKDEEKQMLLSECGKCSDPEAALQNFKECIARVNSKENYNKFAESGFFTIVRESTEKDTRAETFLKLAKHFQLEN